MPTPAEAASDVFSAVWRSILFVPANNDRFVASAVKQAADVLQIDLEDSVPPDQKASARQRVPDIARRFAVAGYDVVVRVNRPWRLLVPDLEAAVSADVTAVTLPKVPDAAHVRAVAEVLAEVEAERGLPVGQTRIIAMIEGPDGLLEMPAIASAHRRVCGLMVGAEDLALSLRMAVTEDGLYFPNVMAVAAARRAGVMPIGFIGSVADFDDLAAFRQRIRRARSLGFDGAFCVHPSQIAVLNEEFAPSVDEIAHATELVAEFDLQHAAGRGAFSFRGRMVDLPVVQQAQQVLHRAAAIRNRQSRR